MHNMNNKIKPSLPIQPQAQAITTAKITHGSKAILLSLLLTSLSACSPEPEHQQRVETTASQLPALVIQQQLAAYQLPACKVKDCTELKLQSIQTQDPWINQWIEQQVASVLEQQTGEKPTLTLQQAVDAYVKKSIAWQHEFNKNKAYQLNLSTQIATQHHQYVLLNISVDSQQGDTNVQERQYFYVADRAQQKNLTLLEVIQPKQHKALNKMIQVKYRAWLQAQDSALQSFAPKQLDWQQANWFFDAEGIGLHFRANDISANGVALSIYLDKQQTQKVLQPAIFKQMFEAVS